MAVNGFGETLIGKRSLTEAEYKIWFENLDKTNELHGKLAIATRVFTLAYMPVAFEDTFVYQTVFHTQTGTSEDLTYIPIFYPAGEGKVYWKHLTRSVEFYGRYIAALIGIFLVVIIKIYK